MLDLLEAGLAGLRLNSAPAVPLPVPRTELVPTESPAPDAAPEIHVPLTTSEALQSEIRLSGMSLDEVAGNLGIERSLLDDWVADRLPVPALALTTLQLLARIAGAGEIRKPAPVAERRKRSAPAPQVEPAGISPEPQPAQSLLSAPGLPTAGQKSLSHPFSRIEDL